MNYVWLLTGCSWVRPEPFNSNSNSGLGSGLYSRVGQVVLHQHKQTSCVGHKHLHTPHNPERRCLNHAVCS
jgi:hypothetical protein